jgi:outer membrane receptor protein involved in Fe transport
LNASLGVSFTGRRSFGSISAYANRLRDFIDFGAPDASGMYTYENIGRGVTRGIDLDGGWTATPVRLEAGYSYLDAFDADSHAPMLGRSRHGVHLDASWLRGRWSLSGSARYTSRAPSRRDDVSGAITEWRDAFARLDLHVQVFVSGTVRFSGGVDNLLNQVPGGTLPGFAGRRLYAGMTLATGG